MASFIDYDKMARDLTYRVPDVMDKIYKDVVLGLYSPIINSIKDDRISIAKCNIACDLLLNSNYGEKFISNAVDIEFIDDFYLLFKNYLGISPGEFRRRFCK